MKIRPRLGWLVVAGVILLTGCNYDFPLTAKPTHLVDDRLLGEWVGLDKDTAKEELMRVRRFDDSTYVVAMDNDLYRVFHSDFAGTPFVSVQDLNSPDRKYTYYVWQLSADGSRLSLKGVSTKVVPENTRDPAAMQRLVERNLANPALYGEEIKFVRKGSR